MIPDLLLPPSDSVPAATADFADRCDALLLQQKLTWDLLRANYANLDDLQTRTLEFDGFAIRLQYNPHRLTSSAAKVDDHSIRERRCFLCPSHLPPAQRAVPFGDDYLILCNPFPIFPEHLTIPTREHVPQRLSGAIENMLALAEAIGRKYTVFYNGPRCGASAPDHLHFQAGTRGLMPLENEYARLKSAGCILIENAALSAYAVEVGLRPFIAFESQDPSALCRALEQLSGKSRDEPMLNVLCSHDAGHWRLIIFPRAKHRPDFFFADGNNQILLSPASVDLGGLCIIPREQDFYRIDNDDLIQMFGEVCLSGPAFRHLCDGLKTALKSLV